jgi:hypothetical protein
VSVPNLPLRTEKREYDREEISKSKKFEAKKANMY